jgi:hypothetical protein
MYSFLRKDVSVKLAAVGTIVAWKHMENSPIICGFESGDGSNE